MENKSLLVTIVLLLLAAILGACGIQSSSTTVEPTTIPAAENLPDSPSPEPTINYRELAEEDLALLIHNTTGEIETAANAASVVMMEAKSDGRLTDEEITKVRGYMQALQSEIFFAKQLVNSYTEKFSDLANETMDLRLVIDDGLDQLIRSINEAKDMLAQDKTAVSMAIDSLNIVLDSIDNQSTILYQQTGIWITDVQIQIDAREKVYANTQPQLSLVAYNRIDAFTQAHDFLDAFTAALNDEKLSAAELDEISQLAATAKSSLYNTGDPLLFTFAEQIDDLSHRASRGEWTQASSGLVALKSSLPARPRP